MKLTAANKPNMEKNEDLETLEKEIIDAAIESSLNILEDLSTTHPNQPSSSLINQLRNHNIEQIISDSLTLTHANTNKNDPNCIESIIHTTVENIFENETKPEQHVKNEISSINSLQIPQNEVSFSNSEKLKIQSIVDAVGFILFPSSGLLNLALKDLLIENDLFNDFQ